MPSDSSQLPGNPKLIQKIVKDISLHGPLTFARFMEWTLYDKDYGYYMTHAVEEGQSSRNRIGWEGDFYTAPELSPILAKTLVRQVVEIDAQLGNPSLFTFIEMGGGNGTFAADFLGHCQAIAPDFLDRLHYSLVERSPYLRALQQSRIQAAIGNLKKKQLTWMSSVDQLDEDSLIGVIFSNELVDALPVHRVRFDNDHLKEIFVDFEKGQFIERLGSPSSPKLHEYVDGYDVMLKEGQTSELHLSAVRWMSQMARALQKGVMITIDYGHTGSDYYAENRMDGTLVCYYQHTISTNPYVRIGEQDMTAHVNFSALAKAGKNDGLFPVGFTTLANWLMGLGVEEMVTADEDPESPNVQALSQLLRPHGMGTTFKVLVQQKMMDAVSLQGLRYRAYFDNVL